MKEYRMHICDVGFCKLSVVEHIASTGCICSRIADIPCVHQGPLSCGSLVWFSVYFYFLKCVVIYVHQVRLS